MIPISSLGVMHIMSYKSKTQRKVSKYKRMFKTLVRLLSL